MRCGSRTDRSRPGSVWKSRYERNHRRRVLAATGRSRCSRSATYAAGARRAGPAWSTSRQPAVQLGEPKAMPPDMVAEVEHQRLSIELEDMRVTDRLGVPALVRHVDAGSAIVSHPRDQVGRARIADPVALFVSAVAEAVAVAEEHVVLAVRENNVRARLALVGLQPYGDELTAEPFPAEAVVGRRHADAVHRFGPALVRNPLRAGDIPEIPAIAEPADLGSADDKRLVEIGRKHGPSSLLLEGDSAITADRVSDGDVERHRSAPRPPAVVRAELVPIPDHRCWIGAELVEG